MKEEKITQQWCVLKWFKEHKYISALEGFNELLIIDLAGCIRCLKEKGYDIGSVWVYKTNRYGKRIKYKKYFMKGE